MGQLSCCVAFECWFESCKSPVISHSLLLWFWSPNCQFCLRFDRVRKTIISVHLLCAITVKGGGQMRVAITLEFFWEVLVVNPNDYVLKGASSDLWLFSFLFAFFLLPCRCLLASCHHSFLFLFFFFQFHRRPIDHLYQTRMHSAFGLCYSVHSWDTRNSLTTLF